MILQTLPTFAFIFFLFLGSTEPLVAVEKNMGYDDCPGANDPWDGCNWTEDTIQENCNTLSQQVCQERVNAGECEGGWRHQEYDCAGVCGGDAELDCSGVCNGMDTASCFMSDLPLLNMLPYDIVWDPISIGNNSDVPLGFTCSPDFDGTHTAQAFCPASPLQMDYHTIMPMLCYKVKKDYEHCYKKLKSIRQYFFKILFNFFSNAIFLSFAPCSRPYRAFK